MASSAAHRAKVRRAERGVLTAHGSLNLVPLVDILTSIVFFALATFSGEILARLTAYDLSLPPVVVTADQAKGISEERKLNLTLAVRIEPDRIQVEHSDGPFRQSIPGYKGASLDQFEALMTQIRGDYPQNADVSVVPADEILYDDVIHVLERLRKARFTGISLVNRARQAAQQAAAAGPSR
ncbi:MAG TPA: biopolymer transporter ExbD [Gemmatimonadaceae bacterium]|nr:biopolymer transporter ExbD [Gemmatimonadaceae bacterium]